MDQFIIILKKTWYKSSNVVISRSNYFFSTSKNYPKKRHALVLAVNLSTHTLHTDNRKKDW